MNIGALAPVDRNVEGVVDATTNYVHSVSLERLLVWLGWCFPPAGNLEMEVDRFLDWLNASDADPPLIKAGLGNLWFVTLHPFDDGNGRVARAIGDLLLAHADGNTQRFYSLSAQIQKDRKAYYEILERTQKGTLDVPAWLAWLLDTLRGAVEDAHRTLDRVLTKSIFWQRWAGTAINARQVKTLNRISDSFKGKLTNSKWASMTKRTAAHAQCGPRCPGLAWFS